MHARTIVVAAVALLSSNVIAQDRPKFYFPRQVKREISNTTSDPVDDSSSSSTKRDLLGDLLGVLTGGSAPPTGAPVASVKPVASTAVVEPGVVKTVIISNTVVVNNGVTTTLAAAPPSSAAATTASKVSSEIPPLIVLPTISLGLSSVLDPILSPPSATDGITAPSGVLGSSGVLAPAPTASTASSGVTFSGTAGTGVSSSTDATDPNYQTLEPSSSSGGGGFLSSILSGLNPDPTGTGTGTGATTTFAPSTSSATPTTSSTDLESMISSIISSGSAGTGVTVFPTGSGSNSTSVRVTPAPTGGDTTSIRGNGTTIVLPPTTTKKPTSVPSLTSLTSLTDIPTTTAAAVPTTSDWVGSSILIQTTQTGGKATTTTAIASGIPSTLPQVVAPLTGVPNAKAGFTLIQVGFTYALNYEFVVANSMSSAQIFSYLPKGIAYGLEIKESDVIMHSLQPYDTSRSLNYITTLALAYIPSNVVSNLGIMIHVPVSRLYKNPSEPVAVIMSSINPSIPITVGSGLDGTDPAAPGSTDGSSPTPDDKDSGNGNGGLFDSNNENNQTPGAKGMTAGIATGAVVAAAAYGAAMFFIARRYKRRKLSHRRARSMMNPGEMMEATGGSPALPGGVYMSGGRQSTGSGESGSGASGDRHSSGSGRSAGNSARTAQISGPMMAENSLGWN